MDPPATVARRVDITLWDHTWAHLGISAVDVWNMTMIYFQRAMDAKYLPKEEDKQKERSSEEESQSWVAYIEAFKRRRST